VKLQAKVANVAPDPKGGTMLVASVEVLRTTTRIENGVEVPRVELVGTFSEKGKSEADLKKKISDRLTKELAKHKASKVAEALVGKVVAEVEG
jgi:hypothetical protein